MRIAPAPGPRQDACRGRLFRHLTRFTMQVTYGAPTLPRCCFLWPCHRTSTSLCHQLQANQEKVAAATSCRKEHCHPSKPFKQNDILGPAVAVELYMAALTGQQQENQPILHMQLKIHMEMHSKTCARICLARWRKKLQHSIPRSLNLMVAVG